MISPQDELGFLLRLADGSLAVDVSLARMFANLTQSAVDKVLEEQPLRDVPFSSAKIFDVWMEPNKREKAIKGTLKNALDRFVGTPPVEFTSFKITDHQVALFAWWLRKWERVDLADAFPEIAAAAEVAYALRTERAIIGVDYGEEQP